MSPEQLIFVVAAVVLPFLALVWWVSAIDHAQAALVVRVALLDQQVADLEPVLKRATAQLETGRGDSEWRAPARVVS